MRLHPISIEKAILIYHNYPELENEQISELFGTTCKSTLTRYKNLVKKEMKARNMLSWSNSAVVTALAYEVWRLDINDLEKRYRKLQRLQQ